MGDAKGRPLSGAVTLISISKEGSMRLIHRCRVATLAFKVETDHNESTDVVRVR